MSCLENALTTGNQADATTKRDERRPCQNDRAFSRSTPFLLLELLLLSRQSQALCLSVFLRHSAQYPTTCQVFITYFQQCLSESLLRHTCLFYAILSYYRSFSSFFFVFSLLSFLSSSLVVFLFVCFSFPYCYLLFISSLHIFSSNSLSHPISLMLSYAFIYYFIISYILFYYHMLSYALIYYCMLCYVMLSFSSIIVCSVLCRVPYTSRHLLHPR